MTPPKLGGTTTPVRKMWELKSNKSDSSGNKQERSDAGKAIKC